MWHGTMEKPVFYDPERKRWRRLRTVFDLVGALVTLVVVFFVISIWRQEDLPNLQLSDFHRTYHGLKEKEKAHRQALAVAASKRKAKRKRQAQAQGSAVVGTSDNGTRAAFYVSWGAGSFSSLKEYYPQIDLLFPEWLHVITPDGRIRGVDESNRAFDIVSEGRIRDPDPRPHPTVMEFLKEAKAETKVFPLVNNYDPVSQAWLASIGDALKDATARKRFREQTLAFLQTGPYGGLCVDIEEIPLDAQPAFLALIQELSAGLHARGLKLYVNVPVNDKDYDYAKLAASADGLILMNYDEHQSGGTPGPIASQEFFAKNVRDALKVIPQDKLIVAIGNYGYEWSSKKFCDRTQLAGGCALTVQEAWIDASESDVLPETDSDSLNPHFGFEEDEGKQAVVKDVWYLDAVTALNQMRAANRMGVNAFALWRLGGEDRSLWGVWDEPSDPHVIENLTTVPPGHEVAYEGAGEILRITQRPENGVRTVKVDAETAQITDQRMAKLPRAYQIDRIGSQAKKIAITFDDGPDPKFTPEILEILKQKKVTATFFLIGIQAEKELRLTRQIVQEGNTVGNHTFTHPDISVVGDRLLEIELNLTERFFGSELGIKPLYFRPPYAIDEEPDTDDQVKPLEFVQDRGYVTIGNKIDPRDWEEGRTAAQITDAVFAVMRALDAKGAGGHVILLHDGGGDRSATVKALPMIIDRLRSEGFQIVPVAELIGKTQAEVMPQLTSNERWAAGVDWIAFQAFKWIQALIVLVFFVGDILMTARLLSVGVLAVIERFMSLRNPAAAVAGAFQPAVAILIPAYNEETVIERTVRSALKSEWPKTRVVVVNDGSKDRTLEVVRENFRKEIESGKVLLLSQANAGKASAANLGLKHITEDIFVAMDADTIIAPDAIGHLMEHFADAEVGAVAGNAKVGNRVNMWTRWQSLEYITSQNFERRALDLLNAVSVVPGAIGAWRTDAVREVGLYPYDTVAEDADLTMSLLQAGFKVQYDDRALAFTEAPIDADGLMRQRFRWSFGILQAVWKHRGAIWRGGTLGWVALPNIFIFQILLPLVSPFIDLMFVFGVLQYFLDKSMHPDTASIKSLEKLVLFFSLFLLIDFLASTLAYLLERKEARQPEDKWLLTQVWLQRFVYRQLFSIVLFKTLKRAIDGRPFNWDKLERTAAVTQAW